VNRLMGGVVGVGVVVMRSTGSRSGLLWRVGGFVAGKNRVVSGFLGSVAGVGGGVAWGVVGV
jgi:hypothetical protein